MKITKLLIAGVVALFLVAGVSAKEAKAPKAAPKAPVAAKKEVKEVKGVCKEKDAVTMKASEKDLLKDGKAITMKMDCETAGGVWVEQK